MQSVAFREADVKQNNVKPLQTDGRPAAETNRQLLCPR